MNSRIRHLHSSSLHKPELATWWLKNLELHLPNRSSPDSLNLRVRFEFPQTAHIGVWEFQSFQLSTTTSSHIYKSRPGPTTHVTLSGLGYSIGDKALASPRFLSNPQASKQPASIHNASSLCLRKKGIVYCQCWAAWCNYKEIVIHPYKKRSLHLVE